MEILARYNKPNNPNQVVYTSYEKYVDSQKQNAENLLQEDSLRPYTYEQWFRRNYGIIPGDEQTQYSDYLKAWYEKQKTNTDTAASSIRTDYINLLKEVYLYFKNQTDFDTLWLSEINWDDNAEIEDVIPLYARKLKEIAIYLVNKRDAIKKAKLKYNMAGSKNALERLFYEYLLKAFTKQDYILNVPEQSAWQSFPYLSAVNSMFSFKIEELYDDTHYFDKDPGVPVSACYDLTNIDVQTYLMSTLEFPGSDINWLYTTGLTPLCCNNPLLWTLTEVLCSYSVNDINNMPLSTFESIENKVLNYYNQFDITKKYLGELKYIISGGYFVNWNQLVSYNFIPGNNWFYWPSGEFIDENDNVNFDPLYLTAADLLGGTASINYRTADKVFVIQNDQISGAWLKGTYTITNTQSMSCFIPAESHVTFKFPFPGYGVSGEDLTWTGKELSNHDKTFNYLDEAIQKDIKKLYWSTITSNSAIDKIYLNDSTLIDNGAKAAQYYNEADHITIRVTDNADHSHDLTPDEMYQGQKNHAWLYKMLKTDIPIKVGQNKIYWPIVRYDTTDELGFVIPSNQCSAVKLSEVNIAQEMIGARAGFSLADSDIIYKLDGAGANYAVECAWLSGLPLHNFGNTSITQGASGVRQPSLALYCQPGQMTTFIWCGTNNTDINTTNIKYKPHQLDCTYLSLSTYNKYATCPINEIDLDTTDNAQWKSCDCKSIVYSPIGHKGTNFDEYKQMADFIVLSDSPSSSFSFAEWRGSDSKDYTQSTDFAWYRITGDVLEPEVGWGIGKWVNYNGTGTFTFRQGHQYRYYHNNLRYNIDQVTNGLAPFMIIKYPYNNNNTIWAKAIIKENGTWQEVDQPSDMVIKPGDYISYDHLNSNWYCITANDSRGSVITFAASATNAKNSPWSNYTQVTVGQTIAFNWPNNYHAYGPDHLRGEIYSIRWTVTTPTGEYHNYFIPEDQSLYITTSSYGTYTVTASGALVIGDSCNAGSLPSITVVPLITTVSVSGSLGSQSFFADSINFSVNIPLSGWAYGSTTGARPFWAKAYDDDSRITKYKGVEKWGGGIRIFDDYVFITQPEFTDIILDLDTYVDYYRFDTTGINWSQPINFYSFNENREWCKLIVYSQMTSPLSGYLYNLDKELVISATNIPSDIIFNSTTDNKMWVNYWANNAFTWAQEISNSSYGFPPSGGKWIPYSAGLVIDPDAPYANLTNRHYPTIASMPYMGNLKSEDDYGSYLIPKGLGLSLYYGKNYTNVINPSSIGNDEKSRGIKSLYNNIELYTKDQGLTQTDQINPIENSYYDASWMKSNNTEGRLGGMIRGAKDHQQFIPYQSNYETNKSNPFGLRNQSDMFDPWIGENDNEWADLTNWPYATFRSEYNIEGWYNGQVPSDKLLYQWKIDIFGNQYGILKDQSVNGIYSRRQANGILYVRNLNGIVAPVSATFPTLYTMLCSYSNLGEELNWQIKDIDLWYDILMIHTSNYIIFEKIGFDFDTGLFEFLPDNLHIIDISEKNYAGSWFFDEDKDIAFSVVELASGIVFPDVYLLDINTNELVATTSARNVASNFNWVSGYNIHEIDDPVFTYNGNTGNYNISLFGYVSASDDTFFITTNISKYVGTINVGVYVPGIV